MSLSESLSVLIEDGIIEEVLGRVMSGKEAEVYAVMYRGVAVAAKVYKAREHRSFKNNAAYVEGRSGGRDTRARRALEKGSAFGRSVAERGWKDMEHHALQLAFSIGVRVPQPILLYENTLLMELIVDEDGQPAPRMSDLEFDADQAVELYKDAYEQIRLLLGAHRVHGDLSPYNILMGTKGPTIIDLPQAIDAAANLRAAEFLERDFRNVTEYLARFAPQLRPLVSNGVGLWQHYRLGTLDSADPMQVTQVSPAARVGGRRRGGGEAHAAPAGQPQPQRTQRRDGRVELVMTPPAPRPTRGLSRDGRAQGRATPAMREEIQAPRRDGRPQQPQQDNRLRSQPTVHSSGNGRPGNAPPNRPSNAPAPVNRGLKRAPDGPAMRPPVSANGPAMRPPANGPAMRPPANGPAMRPPANGPAMRPPANSPAMRPTNGPQNRQESAPQPRQQQQQQRGGGHPGPTGPDRRRPRNSRP